MAVESDVRSFYVVDRDDVGGETARGPFSIIEAEAEVREHEKIITRRKYHEISSQSNGADIGPELSLQQEIHKKTRNWGVGLLILGVISLVPSFPLNAVWGGSLIIVGLASFYFTSASMLVVYGVTIAWAGISNLLSGQYLWMGFALLQFYWTFSMFREFLKLRRRLVEKESSGEDEIGLESRAANAFPPASLILGFIALFGFVVVFFSIIFIAIETQWEQTPDAVLYAFEGMITLGVFAFAIGLASLLSRYKYKWMSILGMIFGGLVLVVFLLLSIAG